MMKKLFLLDAYALIYRAYYAMINNPRINSKKQNTSAVLGFLNTLEEILQKERPTHLAVAFDPKGGTFRHEAYAQYKAQREETPEDIRWAVPVLKELLRAYNIEILEVEGFEADDVIGTIALEAGRRGVETYMMTPDKDYGQLVRDNVFIYKPAHGAKRGEILGPKQICEKYGIKRPEQVIDILALMGDKVDNVPGCPGVGEKTACALMRDYSSIQEIYEDPSRLKGKLKEKILENKEKVLFSKFLVTIKTDVPLAYDEEAMELKAPNYEKLREILKELEFYSFLKRLTGEEPNPKTKTSAAALSNKKVSPNAPIQLDLFGSDSYELSGEQKETILRAQNLDFEGIKLVENEEEQVQILRIFLTRKKFAFSVASTSLDVMRAKFCGLALASEEDGACFLNFGRNLAPEGEVFALLKKLFAQEGSLKLCHDLKPQAQILRRCGIEISAQLFDSMLAHYVLQPEMKHEIFFLADALLSMSLLDAQEVFGPKWKVLQDASALDGAISSQFFGQQALASLGLYPILFEQLRKEDVLDFYEQTELPLALVLADMELTGVRIDTASLQETSRLFTARMKEYEQRAYALSGEVFNISSPKQVGEVLFDKLRLDSKAKKTKTGQYVTSEEVLEALRSESEVVDYILKYRAMKKLLSTYIDALPNLINPETGRIHSSFNQAVTATGRLSSSNPNLQNIPVRGDDGKEIRKAFIPFEGQLFFSADYSQIELRVMAHLSGDLNMIEAFKSGHDIHASTAARIFHKNIDEVLPDERRKAKTANFGILYGISAFGLSQRMEVSRHEAKELIEGYFSTYPKIGEFIALTKEKAKEDGFIQTISHRRRYTPDINSHNALVRGYAERNATNAPIQGSASDIIKIAMVRIFNRFRAEGLRSKMILQVHDELNFSVLAEEKERVERIVREEMENAVALRVPLQADFGWGENWLEAH